MNKKAALKIECRFFMFKLIKINLIEQLTRLGYLTTLFIEGRRFNKINNQTLMANNSTKSIKYTAISAQLLP